MYTFYKIRMEIFQIAYVSASVHLSKQQKQSIVKRFGFNDKKRI